MDTLVLNSAYLPIDRVPWFDAIADLITGRAEVVLVLPSRPTHHKRKGIDAVAAPASRRAYVG